MHKLDCFKMYATLVTQVKIKYSNTIVAFTISLHEKVVVLLNLQIKLFPEMLVFVKPFVWFQVNHGYSIHLKLLINEHMHAFVASKPIF